MKFFLDQIESKGQIKYNSTDSFVGREQNGGKRRKCWSWFCMLTLHNKTKFKAFSDKTNVAKIMISLLD